MRSKKLSPRKATTEKKAYSLKRDNIEYSGCSILVHETYVSLFGQDVNAAHVKIPRKAFNKMIDWYNKEQSIE